MEQVNILVIGAGVVGLSIAQKLSENFEDIVVVETEKSFGRHTSSRNSEVIHSGIYYPQNSLKAELCVNGNKLLYEFAKINKIPHQKCGKYVVATAENEEQKLFKLQQNGVQNSVENLTIISNQEILADIPQLNTTKALMVPSTGIIDTHKLMEKLGKIAEKNGAFIIYEMEVIAIKQSGDKYEIKFSNGEIFLANYVINSAGLFSDKIAEMVGINLQKNNLKLHWCKGEYYKTTKLKGIKKLIYPLPSEQFLGIHLTINLNGEVRFGPNAYFVDDLNYKMNENNKDEFLRAINRYLPISVENLQLDDCGIRAKLQTENESFRDFYIAEETAKGYPNFINLIGIESPGLTSCLSIAEKVKKLIEH
ncbi:MAG: NAD(P)/FAD-dependent oxidoreductase [Candidatus Cloacimonetes bacterium]|jgi:L-2-hydroxyglutarate oxidase LhgO|nr:NAD(P)/FAD-dependent oxidoreductase [Candidatus Cloacimonadota bacterium]MBT6994024.1 NAD(P)/FAD-dependent oxidoreductase [Candidatus Cloacimonadota bacterium]